ncbi:hypothetical protein A6R68_04866 [Neotoma lepida]|uniref:peptide-methionine (S)-S-oxide reductase n=1 Tax=Neotoma lepida TaxID=56216 RepID=A0A1A6GL49_NEOLE|nr:hypothetical protein A6R68_04866 [Neotoma lepida]
MGARAVNPEGVFVKQPDPVVPRPWRRQKRESSSLPAGTGDCVFFHPAERKCTQLAFLWAGSVPSSRPPQSTPPPPICRQQLFLTGVPLSTADGDQNVPEHYCKSTIIPPRLLAFDHNILLIQGGRGVFMPSGVLSKHGFGPITTDIREGQEFYYAEDYHQQYLSKNPDGYCGLGGTGVPHSLMSTGSMNHLLKRFAPLTLDVLLWKKSQGSGKIFRYGLKDNLASKVSIQEMRHHLCGGSIVSEWWILTVAHCFYSEISPTELTVIMGTNDLTTPRTELRVTSIIRHKNFQRYNMDNDIALLLLATPIKFNDLTLPVCLPLQPIPSSWHECWGDSGGPLVCSTESDDRWYQVGIISWGRSCGEKGIPGIYTVLSNYTSWIEKIAQIEGKPLDVKLLRVSGNKKTKGHSQYSKCPALDYPQSCLLPYLLSYVLLRALSNWE